MTNKFNTNFDNLIKNIDNSDSDILFCLNKINNNDIDTFNYNNLDKKRDYSTNITNNNKYNNNKRDLSNNIVYNKNKNNSYTHNNNNFTNKQDNYNKYTINTLNDKNNIDTLSDNNTSSNYKKDNYNNKFNNTSSSYKQDNYNNKSNNTSSNYKKDNYNNKFNNTSSSYKQDNYNNKSNNTSSSYKQDNYNNKYNNKYNNTSSSYKQDNYKQDNYKNDKNTNFNKQDNYKNDRNTNFNKQDNYNNTNYKNDRNTNYKNDRNINFNKQDNYNNENDKNIKETDENIPLDIFNYIKDINEITYVIKKIYDNLNINLIKYQLLQNMEQLNNIKETSYHLVPHYQGYNYLIILTRYNNKCKMYMIIKKDIKNDYKMMNMDEIKLYEIKFKNDIIIEDKYYDLTIFEAKLNYKKNRWFLIIYDMYYISNNNILTEKVINKQNIINTMIDDINHYIYGELEMKVVTYYNIEDISDLVYVKIKNNEFKINGIIFWPIISGKQYIYINDNEFDKIKSGTDVYANSYGNSIQIENQNIDSKRNLIIQKTNKIDVYEVYELDKIQRYGISCVPDLKTSIFLRNIFKSNDQVMFECEFNKKFNKWYPLV